jgi:hypothetical protein
MQMEPNQKALLLHVSMVPPPLGLKVTPKLAEFLLHLIPAL